jgi:DNA-binding beta-propeller fold protein YncE
MKHVLCFGLGLALLASCSKETVTDSVIERNPLLAKKEIPAFSEIGNILLGGLGAAEISAFDPSTNKLFVVNNTNANNRIDVVNLADPSNPVLLSSISIAVYGGLVNSVAVSNGKLAAAIESAPKTNNGKVVVFNTTNYSVVANITVGAQPDMVTFTPNGLFILSANEGEPNADYSVDPIGTVSIIDIANGYSVNTLDFAALLRKKML